jgi:hypothetical protein
MLTGEDAPIGWGMSQFLKKVEDRIGVFQVLMPHPLLTTRIAKFSRL